MNNDKLIFLVQEYPALYNTSHPGYMRIRQKDEIWERVGAEFGVEGSVIKERWNKLRDCHREALRRQKKKSGQKGEFTRPWIYQKEMRFLLPFMKNRSSTSTVEHSFLESGDEDDESTGIRDDEEKQEKSEEITLPENLKKRKIMEMEDIDVQRKIVKSSAIQQLPGQYEEQAKGRDESRPELNSTSKTTEKDALYLFFMAMYGAAKELPPIYQRRIRNNIFKVVSQTEEEYDLNRSMEPTNVETTVHCQSTSLCPPWVEDRTRVIRSLHEDEESARDNISATSTNDLYTRHEHNIFDDIHEIKEECD